METHINWKTARKQEERLQAEKLKKDEDLVPETVFRPSCFPATAIARAFQAQKTLTKNLIE